MNKKTFLIGLVIAIILAAWFGPNFYTTPNEAKRKAKIEAMALEMVLARNHYQDSLRNAMVMTPFSNLTNE